MKAAGISFVRSAVGGHGTCYQAALSAALRMAGQASAKRKVIVFLSDGMAHCSGAARAEYAQQTLAAVSAQNWQRIQINSIGVLEVAPEGEKFMKDLASMNGGTYTRISR